MKNKKFLIALVVLLIVLLAVVVIISGRSQEVEEPAVEEPEELEGEEAVKRDLDLLSPELDSVPPLSEDEVLRQLQGL